MLSLTAYRTPDVLGSVYVAQGAAGDEHRQPPAHHQPPRADAEGRRPKAAAAASTRRRHVRKDFRVLAFWLGSVTTDANGHATRRRQAAGVADDLPHHGGGRRSRRRGSARGDTEVRINKPLTLKPTFPRFLAVGDKALFGAVVTSQLKAAGDATVTIDSLDPAVLHVRRRGASRRCRLPPAARSRCASTAAGEADRPRARPDDGDARRARPTRSRT